MLIKLEKLNIYWENDAKILISSNFLNSCIEEGKLQERYYENLNLEDYLKLWKMKIKKKKWKIYVK